jgi:hypothetical protein
MSNKPLAELVSKTQKFMHCFLKIVYLFIGGAIHWQVVAVGPLPTAVDGVHKEIQT